MPDQDINNDNIQLPSIAVIGGDLRQIHLALMLTKVGYPVTIYGNDPCYYSLADHTTKEFYSLIATKGSLIQAIQSAQIILGPIPFSKDSIHLTSNAQVKDLELSNFLSSLTHRPLLIAGTIPEKVTLFFNEHSIPYVDLMKLESVAIGNAIATAEGTILEAIMHSDINLHLSKCLVLGYGRCAKILAQKLSALNAHVTIAARRPEALATAYASGHTTLPISIALTDLHEYQYIFNTIPSLVLTEESLSTVDPNVTIIDIASKPGGVDYAAAKQKGINAHLCLALPGKYAPKASASILMDQIQAIISKQFFTQ